MIVLCFEGILPTAMDPNQNNSGYHQKTAVLLDRFEPEFANFLSGELIDLFLVPAPGRRYSWGVPATSLRRFALPAEFIRVVYRWLSRWRGWPAVKINLQGAAWIARSYARQLPDDHRHLIVAQEFLPFLWRDGVLQGRRFSVLLTRPPLGMMNERLDAVAREFPRQSKLQEFQADSILVQAESEALQKAERVITPHRELGHLFANLRLLEWNKPEVVPPAGVRNPSLLLLPAPLAMRDGAHAALGASERLALPLLICGSNSENLAVESDAVHFTTESEIPWHQVAAVVHPTLFKAWPRLHLHALALGIPVVTTSACGLEEGDGVSFVDFNDEDGLVRAIERAMARELGRETGRETEPRRDFHHGVPETSETLKAPELV
jgi:glycosyltransferase involved in cell wall biosynthesis